MRIFGLIVSLLVVVLAFAACVSMAAEDPAVSDGPDIVTMRVDGIVIDGNMWVNLTQNEKWTYLFGFEDGARDTAIHYVPDAGTRDIIYEGLPTSLGEEKSIKYLIAEIDSFYSNDKNRTIPVNAALLTVRNRLMGVDEENIEKYVNYLRGNREEQ